MNWKKVLRWLTPFSPNDPYVQVEQGLYQKIVDLASPPPVSSQYADNDQFHARVAQAFGAAVMAGQVNAIEIKDRFRITWVCSKCNELHTQSGDIRQTFETFSAFIQLGYPYVRVENAGFAEMASLDSTESDPRQTATNYRAFLEATHRD